MAAATTTIHAEPETTAAVSTSVQIKKRRTPMLIASLATTAALIAGTYAFLTRGQESTDDAQVEGRVMNVSARVSGQVLRVHVEDNQVVNPGDVLIELDPADSMAKVAAAKADLSAAKAAADGARSALALTEKTAPAMVQQARGGMTAASSSITSASAAIDQAKADVAASESRRALAALNLKRSQALYDTNAVAIAEVDTRKTELASASAEADEAKARLAAAQASLAGVGGGMVLAQGKLSVADTAAEQVASAKAALTLAEARVEQAQAALTIADLNLSYTQIKATRHGLVSRRSVEEGQTVAPDRPLFAVVPLDDVWIVANFKEDQMSKMHAGEPATVQLDTYGRRELKGHVDSISGGTGARFALLPPDNATGNFVKVVQRIPVLIRLDGETGVELRPGMSADVTVRVEP